MNWTLQIEEQNSEPIVAAEQLSLRLNQLHEFSKGDPLFAVVNAPDGSTLAVGLGRELSVLSYTAPGGWPAKHVISNNADERLLSYRFLGHFSEIPASYAVPLEEAISATVEFFKTGGKLSNQLNWEDD
jgi:hypothetical protein